MNQKALTFSFLLTKSLMTIKGWLISTCKPAEIRPFVNRLTRYSDKLRHKIGDGLDGLLYELNEELRHLPKKEPIPKETRETLEELTDNLLRTFKKLVKQKNELLYDITRLTEKLIDLNDNILAGASAGWITSKIEQIENLLSNVGKPLVKHGFIRKKLGDVKQEISRRQDKEPLPRELSKDLSDRIDEILTQTKLNLFGVEFHDEAAKGTQISSSISKQTSAVTRMKPFKERQIKLWAQEPINAISFGDVDDDNRSEIIFASHSPKVQILDPHTEEYESISIWEGISAIKVHNGYLYLGLEDNTLGILNPTTKEIEKIELNALPVSICFGDVDGDEKEETVISGCGMKNFIEILKYNTPTSFEVRPHGMCMALDINNDGKDEIILTQNDDFVSELYLYKKTERGLEKIRREFVSTSLSLIELREKDRNRILLAKQARGEGRLLTLDGVELLRKDYQGNSAYPGDLNGDGHDEIILASAEQGIVVTEGEFKVSFPIEAGEEIVGLSDLEGTGKDDIILYKTGQFRVLTFEPPNDDELSNTKNSSHYK